MPDLKNMTGYLIIHQYYSEKYKKTEAGISSRLLLLLNWHYSISDKPATFSKIEDLPFPAGLDFSNEEGDVRDNYITYEAIGVGFAREMIEHKGKNYMTGVMGKDGHTTLGFTSFKWTETFLELNKNPS